jgi:hypothetical protein
MSILYNQIKKLVALIIYEKDHKFEYFGKVCHVFKKISICTANTCNLILSFKPLLNSKTVLNIKPLYSEKTFFCLVEL